MTEISNPFIFYHLRDGKYSHIHGYKFLNQFKYTIYILCLKDNEIHNDDIFKLRIDTTLLNKYELVKANLSMFIHLKDKFLIIDSDTLDNYYNNDYLNEELVLPLYYLKKQNVISLLKLNNGLTNIYEVMSMFQILEYTKISYLNKTQLTNFTNMIINCNENMYWSLDINCKQNITLFFIDRAFKLTDVTRITDEDIKKIIQTIETEGSDNNYLSFLYRKKLYIDASSGLKKKGYKLYTITYNPICQILNNQTFLDILHMMMNNKQYKLMINLIFSIMKSKELCHLVVNNIGVWKLIKTNIEFFGTSIYNRYLPLIHYLMKYVWLTFYTEEGIKNSYLTNKDRNIFNGDTAAELPVFSLDKLNPQTNPYLPMLIMKNILSPELNIHGVNLISVNNEFDYGVNTTATFLKRLNIFMTNDENINIFDDLNWKKYNYGVTGSCMTACGIKKNPLEYKFNNFKNFVDAHYGSADLDFMCTVKNFEFVDALYELIDTIKQNVKKYYNEDVEFVITSTKNVNITFDITYALENIVDDQISLEHIISDINDERIKEKVYKIYVKEKINMINNKNIYWKDIKYRTVFDIVNKDQMNITLFNKHKNKFSYTENLKYKLKCARMNRAIEFFSVYGSDHFTVVAKFHLPCVRAYYNGDHMWVTPSYISAAMTFMNIDYKFFSGQSHPCELILKYQSRGFGIYLNDLEKQRYISYAYAVPKWRDLLKLDIKNKKSINDVLKPHDIYYNLYSKHDIEEFNYTSNREMHNIWKRPHKLFDIKIITDEGYLTPMKNHLINYYIEEL
jgi:hypothetical protein